MTAFLSQSLGLSPTLKARVYHHEETKVVISEKQGITTILGSDPTKPSSSLRRTLSADMSSKKWLSQNGLIPKNALAHIADSSSSEEEDDEEDSYEDKRKESRDLEKSSQFDIWSSIISQKREEPSVQAPPPYVHPMVRRSASSLSEKSLEICTESLGSETGSDRFSSYPASEMGDHEDDKESDTVLQDLAKLQSSQEDRDQQLHFTKYSNYTGLGKKRQQQKSFPPPLSWLSHPDGASLRMQSRRDNGRLVLEAISVPSEKNFCVQRQDGRLVLTFNVNGVFQHVSGDNEAVAEGAEQLEEALELDEEFLGSGESDEKEEEEGEDEKMEKVEEEEGEEEAKKLILTTEDAPPNILASGDVNNVHKIAILMNKKPMDLGNGKSRWPNKFNEVVMFSGKDDNEEDGPILFPQSLPPLARVARVITERPPPSAAASNAYEYFWRTKSTITSAAATRIINPTSSPQQQSLALKSYSNNYIITKHFVSNDQQHQKQGEDFWDSGVNSCKESRRSLLFWEPHCIATS